MPSYSETPLTMTVAARGNQQNNRAYRFIDLFAGIGGLRLGFEDAGARCVFASEIDKYALLTYRDNFDHSHPVAGDIRAVPSSDVPEHDILLAGFPCQPFSVAGISKRNALGRPHGFACTTEGTLFYEVARLLRDHRPAAFVLENVKHLVRHDSGRTFHLIVEILSQELGYRVSWKVIDARHWVPQHRERVFVVGFRDDVEFDWGTLLIPGLPTPNLGDILHPEDGSGIVEAPYTDSHGRPSEKYILTDKLWQYLQNYAKKHQLRGNGFGFGLVGAKDVARTLSARYYKDGSEILIRRRNPIPRRLTPRECSRLMGFDRGRKHPFRIPVSDTRAYEQFGNAVVVPVVKAVASLVLRALAQNSKLMRSGFRRPVLTRT
jgi:DNA (cytosine-5)-methyltransferase 1